MSARDTGKNKAVEVGIGECHRPWTTAATVAHHRVKANSQPTASAGIGFPFMDSWFPYLMPPTSLPEKIISNKPATVASNPCAPNHRRPFHLHLPRSEEHTSE